MADIIYDEAKQTLNMEAAAMNLASAIPWGFKWA
jgi:hypothetical protein